MRRHVGQNWSPLGPVLSPEQIFERRGDRHGQEADDDETSKSRDPHHYVGDTKQELGCRLAEIRHRGSPQRTKQHLWPLSNFVRVGVNGAAAHSSAPGVKLP
jgi:hypothetical protein